MTPARETIMEALLAKFDPMIDNTSDPIPAGKVRAVSRRLVTYDQCATKPAIFISEASEVYANRSENLTYVTIQPILFLYIDTGLDQNTIPATTLNNLLDAIDAALAPDDPTTLKCTLGGLVSHCYVSGEVPKVPGDLDGEGMAVLPINILVSTSP